MTKRAFFPGSFDPFTRGHDSIVKRTLTFVEEVVIAIGTNLNKKTFFSSEARLQMLTNLYQAEKRVKIITYEGLTMDAALDSGATFIVRGVRSISDYEYERTLADINKQISKIETIFLFTEPHLSSISSSAVRELLHFNRDVTPFLPEGLKIENWK